MSNFLAIVLFISAAVTFVFFDMSTKREYHICYDSGNIAFYIGLTKIDPLVSPQGTSCRKVKITKERAIQISHQIKNN